MTERIAETLARPRARITGVIYLFYFLTAVFGEFLLKGIFVSGDATATASNILAHQPLFRLGLANGLIATVCYVAVTALRAMYSATSSGSGKRSFSAFFCLL